MNNLKFVTELSKLRSSSTFLSLKGYINEYSEIADYNLVFHISYRNALEKSLSMLEALNVFTDLEIQAKEELITSFQTSLNKVETIPIEEIDDAYDRFFDDNGNYIKGVKLHRDSNTLHLYGLVVHKKIIQPGNYPTKTKNSKPITITKDKLRNALPVGKFRQWKIVPGQVEAINVQGLSLLPPNDFVK